LQNSGNAARTTESATRVRTTAYQDLGLCVNDGSTFGGIKTRDGRGAALISSESVCLSARDTSGLPSIRTERLGDRKRLLASYSVAGVKIIPCIA
jgi:hypothetical protein